MAYFRENEAQETKRQRPVKVSEAEPADMQEQYIESDYDDGFDDPAEEIQEEEISEEEQKAARNRRFRAVSGAWNVIGVILGTLVILVLLGFLLRMVSFVLNDADRNFTLFQIRF